MVVGILLLYRGIRALMVTPALVQKKVIILCLLTVPGSDALCSVRSVLVPSSTARSP